MSRFVEGNSLWTTSPKCDLVEKITPEPPASPPASRLKNNVTARNDCFHLAVPEVAKRETRVLETRYPRDGLPAGSYGYLELYCADPTCDCRRVLLQVRAEAQPKTVLATINYGWESVAFYTQLLPGYPKLVRQLKQASLDPLIPQSRFAPLFLRLFQTVVLQDRAYIQRLQRHYAMFKQHLAQEPPASSANDR